MTREPDYADLPTAETLANYAPGNLSKHDAQDVLDAIAWSRIGFNLSAEIHAKRVLRRGDALHLVHLAGGDCVPAEVAELLPLRVVKTDNAANSVFSLWPDTPGRAYDWHRAEDCPALRRPKTRAAAERLMNAWNDDPYARGHLAEHLGWSTAEYVAWVDAGTWPADVGGEPTRDERAEALANEMYRAYYAEPYRGELRRNSNEYLNWMRAAFAALDGESPERR